MPSLTVGMMLKSLSPRIIARRATASKLGFTWMPHRMRSFSRVFQQLSTSKIDLADRAVVESSALHHRVNAKQKPKLNDTIINIFSHNVRGLVKDEHMGESMDEARHSPRAFRKHGRSETQSRSTTVTSS